MRQSDKEEIRSDRKLLDSLLEKYGKEDVMEYINGLNESVETDDEWSDIFKRSTVDRKILRSAYNRMHLAYENGISGPDFGRACKVVLEPADTPEAHRKWVRFSGTDFVGGEAIICLYYIPSEGYSATMYTNGSSSYMLYVDNLFADDEDAQEAAQYYGVNYNSNETDALNLIYAILDN